MTLELRSALLDDRDVLLCGNHLCGILLVMLGGGCGLRLSAEKLESKIVGTFCSSVSDGGGTYFVGVGGVVGRGRWSIRGRREVSLPQLCGLQIRYRSWAVQGFNLGARLSFRVHLQAQLDLRLRGPVVAGGAINNWQQKYSIWQTHKVAYTRRRSA